MRRRVTSIFTILSLLIFVLGIVLWVRSYYVRDVFVHRTAISTSLHPPITRTIHYELEWCTGSFCIERYHGEWDAATAQDWFYDRYFPRTSYIAPPRPGDRFNFLFAGCQLAYAVETVQYVPNDRPRWYSDIRLVLPFWVLLPTGIPPAMWLLRWRRQRREGRGFTVQPTGARSNAAEETAA